MLVCVLFVFFATLLLFFFFKQKTAYEMRISDWSSDVCSSDLVRALGEHAEAPVGLEVGLLHEVLGVGWVAGHPQRRGVERAHVLHRELGEASLVSHHLEPTVRSPPDRKSTRLNSSH